MKSPFKWGHGWETSSISLSNLTHWGRDKIAAISQTAFSNAISSIKISNSRLSLHWRLFLSFQLTMFQNLAQIMVWCPVNDKPLSGSLMLNVLMHICLNNHNENAWLLLYILFPVSNNLDVKTRYCCKFCVVNISFILLPFKFTEIPCTLRPF